MDSTSRNGYHGYAWKNLDNIFIHCFTIPAFKTKNGEETPSLEAAEAELTYLYRQDRNKWPEFQTEIHFSNDELGRKLAKTLYEELKKLQSKG
jgi:hypothetical protein